MDQLTPTRADAHVTVLDRDGPVRDHMVVVEIEARGLEVQRDHRRGAPGEAAPRMRRGRSAAA
jgi:hypothetical protein